MIKVKLTTPKLQAATVPEVGEVGVVVSGTYAGYPIIHGFHDGHVWVVLTDSGTSTITGENPPYPCRKLAGAEHLTIEVTA